MTRPLVQFGLALLVAAGFLAWLSSMLYRGDAQYQRWATSNATILASAVVRQFDPEMSMGTNNKQQLYWMIKVSYLYDVGGVSYTGTRLSNDPPLVSAGSETTPPASLATIRDRLSPGTVVSIRYAPNHPQSSYIEVASGGWRRPLIVAGAFAIIALLAVGFAFRS